MLIYSYVIIFHLSIYCLYICRFSFLYIPKIIFHCVNINLINLIIFENTANKIKIPIVNINCVCLVLCNKIIFLKISGDIFNGKVRFKRISRGFLRFNSSEVSKRSYRGIFRTEIFYRHQAFRRRHRHFIL